MMKSCQSCPSFVPTDEVPIVFGRSTGAPMCARFSHVLGRPGLSDSGMETAAVAFAMRCDSYGQPRPDKPEATETRVTNPDLGVMAEVAKPGFTPDSLPTCRSCKNCVGMSTVATELGYPLDLCRAKGRLILRPQNEAKGCPFAMAGPPSTSTDGLELREEFREGYRIPTEHAAAAVFAVGNTNVDPLTYKSDVPVDAEDEALGIRAWRLVKQPDGPNEVYLPIFKRERFTPEQQALIPATGSDMHPELYVDYDHKLYRFAVDSYEDGDTICLQALPGTGKTEFARWCAWLMQVPFYPFNFRQSSEAAHILGAMAVNATDNGPETRFVLGRLPVASMGPCIILLDELNLAAEEITESLRSYFLTGELIIEEANPAITVKKDQFCFPMVAQNPAWDVRNRGAKELAAADYSRLMPLAVEMPPEAVERHIIKERCKVKGYVIPESTLDVLMKIAADLREASSPEQQTIPFTWGIRESIRVAVKTRRYSLPMAFKAAALDFYEPQVVEFCMKIVNDYIEA